MAPNIDVVALEREAKRKEAEGNYEDCLKVLESILQIYKLQRDSTSPEYEATCKYACDVSNILAINHLKQNEFVKALELLKFAEVLSEKNEEGLAQTYNNFACYYRRQ